MLELLSFGDRGWGDELLRGTLMTMVLSIPAFLLGGVIGTTAASLRQSESRTVSALVYAYTTVVRGVPELVLIYLIFFGGGQAIRLVLGMFGYAGDFSPNALVAGILSLGLVSGAYATEVMRGAYKMIDKGQVEAAMAFGWTKRGAFLRVTFPQLLRIALPGLGNVWLLTLKDSALISVTGLVELMRAATVATGSTRMPLYFYGAAMLLYLLMSGGSTAAFDLLERHTRKGLRVVSAK